MYLKSFDLKNKIALVTGAGKGIGRASAIALAEAGADLIILSRTESDLKKVEKEIKKLKIVFLKSQNIKTQKGLKEKTKKKVDLNITN